MSLQSCLLNLHRHSMVISQCLLTARRSQRRAMASQSSVEVLERRCLLTTIDLANLGTGGVTIFGVTEGDLSGYSVSDVGDVNGDGFDDILIGANRGDGVGDAKYAAGESYVVFGGTSLTSTIDLANLGSGGITIIGVDASDQSGRSVSGAGDVNGDGFDDLLIGADRGSGVGNAKSNCGESYLIFGGAALPPTIALSNLGVAGVTIFGADSNDQSGLSVSTAGDINGDGFDDLLIGAPFSGALGNAKTYAGESYVIFGRPTFPAAIDLSTPNSAGVTIFGADAGDNSGHSVSSAGDVNGDGFDDLLIGALSSSSTGNSKSNAGESYVVFGGASLPSTINLGTLGTAGVTLFGADILDFSGYSVSNAGDVNGDGFDDILISASRGDAAGDTNVNAGETYVVFGGASLPAVVDFSSLGAAGMTIFGIDTIDYSGQSVSAAGDVNGDGFDDLLIGAMLADGISNAQSYAGESYLIFGSSTLPLSIDLANLATAGITIFGIDAGDNNGKSVSSAGDVNGDGFDDFLIGARTADGPGNARPNAGETYLIYGGDFTNSITHPGSPSGETLVGSPQADVINGAAGNDTLISNGGADVVYGGNGDDILSIANSAFRRLDGGNGSDTLRLDGTGLGLDLTALPDNRITNIETIDLRGNGINSLILNVREVLNLTRNSNPAHTNNTLTVIRDANDPVNIGPGWSTTGTQTIDGQVFAVLTQEAATLKINNLITLSLGGPAVTFVNRQPPIAILPQLTVAGSGILAGGTLSISVKPVATPRKLLDQFNVPGSSGFGTTTGPQSINGKLVQQFQLNQAATTTNIQAFLRGITFATKGKGLRTLTRTFDVTLTDAGGFQTTVQQTINVRKRA